MILKNPQQSLKLTSAKEDPDLKLDLIFLLIFLIVIFSVFLGSRPLNNPDEGRYAEIAREMAVSNDFITPKLNAVKFFDKPVFAYWLSALSIKAFGVNEWAARTIPALFAILSILFTYLITRYIYNRQAAWLAAIILALSPVYFGAGHYINVDMVVGALISMSLLCCWFGLTDKYYTTKKGQKIILLGYFFSGLAVLTKGLIGLVFPIGIVGLWLLLTKQMRRVKNLRLFLGPLIFLVITLPWYIIVQIKNPEFFDYFFIYQQYQRYITTTVFNNPMPFWFYIPIFLVGTFPWSCFLPQAIYVYYKENKLFDKDMLFLVIWFMFILLFFSIPSSKLISYILPLFPPAAIIVGKFLQENYLVKPSKLILRGAATIVVLFALLALIAVVIINVNHPKIVFIQEAKVYIYLIALTLLIIPFMGYKKLFRYGLGRFITSIIITQMIFFGLTLKAVPYFANDSVKSLALSIKPQLSHKDEIICFYNFYHDLPFYLEKRVTIVEDWDIGENCRDNYQRYFALASKHQNTQEWLIDKSEFVRRWKKGGKIYVFANANRNALEDFLKKKKLPYYFIAANKRAKLFTNKK